MGYAYTKKNFSQYVYIYEKKKKKTCSEMKFYLKKVKSICVDFIFAK